MASDSSRTDLGQLGDYQLLAKLGEGGMGAVYKARQLRLDKIVALKVLPKDRMADKQARTRFEREMKAVGRVDHPNVVRAMDARDIDGTTVLVMEYVDGKDLAQVLQQVGVLPVADACEVVRQAAEGLQCAHENQLIHRDIKPSNLMLTRRGQVKILDLGLARLCTDQPGADELTSAGSTMGTADYTAPEQVSDAHSVDIRADIYSLGCTLYTLLSGQAPFSGPQYKLHPLKLVGHLQNTPTSIRLLRSDVSEELGAVIERMMAKDPAGRYSTPAEVAAAMSPFAARCDLTHLSAQATARAKGIAHVEEHLAVTEPQASSAQRATQPTVSLSPHAASAPPAAFRLPSLLARYWKPLTVAVGVMFAMVVLRLAIRIKDSSGRETVATLHKRSEVTIEEGTEGVSVTPLPLAREEPGGRAPSPFIGPDGNWNLPPGAPPPVIAPFDTQKAKEHQEAWANYLGVPVEMANSLGMKFQLIPPGEFHMGSTLEEIAWAGQEGAKTNSGVIYVERVSYEGPQHRVRISEPYYLGVCEVTQIQYQQVMGSNPSSLSIRGKGKGHVRERDTSRNPVETVSWEEAMEFCRSLSALPEERTARRTYQLPTEAQWEHACRAGTTTPWSCGDDDASLLECAWLQPNSNNATHPVGEKKPNPWRLYDMHGNVSEWCLDWDSATYYAQSPRSDPRGPLSGLDRISRGGTHRQDKWWCRSASRLRWRPTTRPECVGFRVVCDITSSSAIPSSTSGTPRAPSRH